MKNLGHAASNTSVCVCFFPFFMFKIKALYNVCDVCVVRVCVCFCAILYECVWVSKGMFGLVGKICVSVGVCVSGKENGQVCQGKATFAFDKSKFFGTFTGAKMWDSEAITSGVIIRSAI